MLEAVASRTMCSDGDLDLIECAIHRVLKQEVDAETHNRRRVENVPDAEIAAEHADAGEAGVNTRNVSLLSRLIEEVHAMRMKKASEQKFDHKPVEQQEPSVQKGKGSTDPADAAVKAAVAAADAAQAAAASVAKNSEIIEVLLETVRIRIQEMDLDEDEDDSHAHTKAAKKISEKKTVVKIVKELHKQNIFTHVILGLMVVTTAYWRFKEISWILRLRKVMSNPLEAVGVLFGGDPQQQQKYSHKEEVETKTLQLPKLELPKILQMNEVEEKISP